FCSSVITASCIWNQPATAGTERASASASRKTAYFGSFQGGSSSALRLAGQRFITLAWFSGLLSHSRKVFAPSGFLAPTGIPMVQPPPRLILSGAVIAPHFRSGILENAS